MKILIGSTILIAGVGLVGGMGLSLPAAAEEHATSSSTHQMSPKFPQSDKCSTSSPCQNVIGEITKVEESYWIKMPNGQETHMRVSADTKMDCSCQGRRSDRGATDVERRCGFDQEVEGIAETR